MTMRHVVVVRVALALVCARAIFVAPLAPHRGPMMMSQQECFATRTYEALGAREVVDFLRSSCMTYRGRSRAFGSVEAALTQSERECRELWNRVSLLVDEEIDVALQSLDEEFDEIVFRSNRTIEVDELVKVKDGGDAALDLFKNYPRYAIEEIPSFFEYLSEALVEEDSSHGLSGDLFPEVGAARQFLEKAQKDVEAAKRRTKISEKECDFFRLEGRWVVGVPAISKNSKDYVVHGTSKTGKTAYVEPVSLVKPTNDEKQARSYLRKAENAALRVITRKMREERHLIDKLVDNVALFDADRARTILGDRWQGQVPEIATGGIIKCDGLCFGPLALSKREKSIGNDVDLCRGERNLIISGANAGGKTVFMKSVGLAALLLRLGVPVPCLTTPKISYFHSILADVGDGQELGQSTYVAHLRFVKHALEQNQALVLLDEIGSGTDPKQGAAVGRATLEQLTEKGAVVVATTHHAAIKEQLSIADSRFVTAATGYDDRGPTFKVEYGVVGESRALDAARREGLPESLLARAKDLVGEEEVALEILREELREATFRVKETERKLELQREEAKSAKMAFERKELEAEEFAKKARAELALEFEKKLLQILEDQKVAEKEERHEILERAASEAKEVRQVAEARNQGLEPLKDVAEVNTGDKIVILKEGAFYGKIATVSAAGRRSNSLSVDVDGASLFTAKPLKLKANQMAKIQKDALEAYNERRRRQKKVTAPRGLSRRAAAAILDENQGTTATAPLKQEIQMRTSRNTLDLRGYTLEDAERETDFFLDRCLRANLSVAYLLHGHGTGVLKNGMRSYLKSQSRVKAATSAAYDDGGDAFTKLELR